MSSLVRPVLNALRGVAIGLAEIVPGVSGGTIALIVGVYQTLIRSLASLVQVVLSGLRSGFPAMRGPWRQVSWSVVLPVGVGMLGGIFAGAWLLEPILVQYPLETRAVFAGLILASLWVPVRMVGSAWSPVLVLVTGVSASLTFVALGLPGASLPADSLLWVAPAAALAVCALVLPGVSGSYLLLTLGMYQPTIAAVNDRDVGYLGVFVAGALVGLALFVRGLQWLLSHHMAITLAVMTGLMLGSLRALWPWQGDSREVLAPEGNVIAVVGLAFAGFAVVVAMMVTERVLASRLATH